MNIRVNFAGGKKVDAQFGKFVIRTDQSVPHGGSAAAPEPFELFLSSLATCAGSYVLAFCQTRGIPTEDIELVQRHRFDEYSKRLVCIDLELALPDTFPEEYRSAVVKAVESCKVKKLLATPPDITVTLRVPELGTSVGPTL